VLLERHQIFLVKVITNFLTVPNGSHLNTTPRRRPISYHRPCSVG